MTIRFFISLIRIDHPKFISHGIIGSENWIFHTELTWLYVESSSSIGTWFWSEKLGWGWSRKDLWPYIWKNSPEGWVYFFGNQDGTLTFWDYSNSEFLRL